MNTDMTVVKACIENECGPLGRACAMIREIKRPGKRPHTPVAWPTIEEVMSAPGFNDGDDGPVVRKIDTARPPLL
jgi:hypothetical protein